VKRAILLVGLAAACQPSAPLVVHAPTAKHAFEAGDEVAIHRAKPVDDPKMSPGYRVIRNREEWAIAWRGTHGARPPDLPPKLDLGKDMLLWARGQAGSSSTIKITRVIRNYGLLHVYVEETTPGDNCRPRESDDVPVDMVAVQQIDAQVHFHIARAPSAPCGKPPEVAVSCKVRGGPAGGEQISAAPGDTIDCDGAGTRAQGGSGIVDRNWYVKWPDGSASKLTYENAGQRVSFKVDAYGTYMLTLEAADEELKRGTKVVTVDVLPPKDELLVQVSWAGFESGDDPETFPRLEPKVFDRPGKAYLEPTECSLAVPAKPLWCKIAQSGIAKHFHVLTEVDTDYTISVRYLDDRYDRMPYVCVTAFSLGRKLSTLCDERPRTAGETWDVGRYLGRSRVLEPTR
jgi:hypothetical protein